MRGRHGLVLFTDKLLCSTSNTLFLPLSLSLSPLLSHGRPAHLVIRPPWWKALRYALVAPHTTQSGGLWRWMMSVNVGVVAHSTAVDYNRVLASWLLELLRWQTRRNYKKVCESANRRIGPLPFALVLLMVPIENHFLPDQTTKRPNGHQTGAIACEARRPTGEDHLCTYVSYRYVLYGRCVYV